MQPNAPQPVPLAQRVEGPGQRRGSSGVPTTEVKTYGVFAQPAGVARSLSCRSRARVSDCTQTPAAAPSRCERRVFVGNSCNASPGPLQPARDPQVALVEIDVGPVEPAASDRRKPEQEDRDPQGVQAMIRGPGAGSSRASSTVNGSIA